MHHVEWIQICLLNHFIWLDFGWFTPVLEWKSRANVPCDDDSQCYLHTNLYTIGIWHIILRDLLQATCVQLDITSRFIVHNWHRRGHCQVLLVTHCQGSISCPWRTSSSSLASALRIVVYKLMAWDSLSQLDSRLSMIHWTLVYKHDVVAPFRSISSIWASRWLQENCIQIDITAYLRDAQDTCIQTQSHCSPSTVSQASGSLEDHRKVVYKLTSLLACRQTWVNFCVSWVPTSQWPQETCTQADIAARLR